MRLALTTLLCVATLECVCGSLVWEVRKAEDMDGVSTLQGSTVDAVSVGLIARELGGETELVYFEWDNTRTRLCYEGSEAYTKLDVYTYLTDTNTWQAAFELRAPVLTSSPCDFTFDFHPVLLPDGHSALLTAVGGGALHGFVVDLDTGDVRNGSIDVTETESPDAMSAVVNGTVYTLLSDWKSGESAQLVRRVYTFEPNTTTWQPVTVTSAISPRQFDFFDYRFVPVNGAALTFGNDADGEMWKFDITTNAFSVVDPDGNTPDATGLVFDGAGVHEAAYFVGGGDFAFFNATAARFGNNRVYEYSHAHEEFTKLRTLPALQKTSNPVIAAHDGVVYVFGGFVESFGEVVPVLNLYIGQITCPAGLILVDGQCVACPVGTTSVNGVCVECRDLGGYATEIASQKCTKCANGYESTVDSLSCQECNAGYASSKGVCVACDRGTYSDDDGATHCTPCSAGFYSNVTAGTECLACGVDTYAKAGSATCSNCPVDHVTEGSTSTGPDACICKAGTYQKFTDEGSCAECPTGATCPPGSTYPIPDAGYFLVLPDYIVVCDSKEACVGGGVGKCGKGYKGYLCGECEAGWYKFNGACLSCPRVSTDTWVWAPSLAAYAMLVCVLIGFGAKRTVDLKHEHQQMSRRKLNKQHQINASSASGSGSNSLNFSTFSVGVTFLQVSAVLVSFRINWPEELLTFLGYFSALNFNIDFTSPECTRGWTYREKWILSMCAPFIIAVIVGITYGLLRAYSKCCGVDVDFTKDPFVDSDMYEWSSSETSAPKKPSEDDKHAEAVTKLTSSSSSSSSPPSSGSSSSSSEDEQQSELSGCVSLNPLTNNSYNNNNNNNNNHNERVERVNALTARLVADGALSPAALDAVVRFRDEVATDSLVGSSACSSGDDSWLDVPGLSPAHVDTASELLLSDDHLYYALSDDEDTEQRESEEADTLTSRSTEAYSSSGGLWDRLPGDVQEIINQAQSDVTHGFPATSLNGAFDRCIALCLVFCSVGYIFLATKSVEIFACTRDEASGKLHLDASPDIICYEDAEWKQMQVAAIFGIIFYAFGIPFTFLSILWLNRGHINENRIQQVSRFGILFQNFDVDDQYWILMLMSRKIALVLISVLIPRDMVLLQALTGLSVLFILLLIHVFRKPFRSSVSDKLETITLTANVYTLMTGVAFVVTSDNATRNTFAVSAMAVIGATIAVIVIFISWELYRNYRFKTTRGEPWGKGAHLFVGREKRIAKLGRYLVKHEFLPYLIQHLKTSLDMEKENMHFVFRTLFLYVEEEKMKVEGNQSRSLSDRLSESYSSSSSSSS